MERARKLEKGKRQWKRERALEKGGDTGKGRVEKGKDIGEGRGYRKRKRKLEKGKGIGKGHRKIEGKLEK